MELTAILGVLATLAAVLDNSLVRRVLQNIVAKTPNVIDDWVLEIIYEAAEKKTPPGDVNAKLATVQERYDAMTPEKRAEAKASPSRFVPPWAEAATE